MVANRYADLTRGLMIATALSVTLGGCVGVEYDKVADRKTKNSVMPIAAAATVEPVATASNAPVIENAAASPQGAQILSAQAMPNAPQSASPASATGSGGFVSVGPELASAGSTDPLAATASDAGIALAFAPPPRVVVPVPRPDIIAAANSLPVPTDATEVQSAALAGTEPANAALKDVENLELRLASTDPASGNINPLTSVAIPTQRPGPQSMGLEAYANTPSMMALDAFDTSSPQKVEAPALAPNARLQSLIEKYATLYQVPEALVHRVIRRESNYNPAAYSLGNYGLMQIRYNTARGLGYTGSPAGLFDAETNLKYAVKYLRGAFMVAENNHDNAVRLYARGYYYDAKRKGMLEFLQ